MGLLYFMVAMGSTWLGQGTGCHGVAFVNVNS